MSNLKQSFIKLSLQCGVLQFGEFTLKSGRISPYFYNVGLFYHGKALKQVGEYYAKTLLSHKAEFEHLFGPAYKGLPLATATAIALAETGKNVSVTFNRKEEKKHGEGGKLIGAPLTGNTIIIDDVITAGTAFREAQQLISKTDGNLTGVIIALDRCEQGIYKKSTLTEITEQGIDVYSIITIYDLIDYLIQRSEHDMAKKMRDYLEIIS